MSGARAGKLWAVTVSWALDLVAEKDTVSSCETRTTSPGFEGIWVVRPSRAYGEYARLELTVSFSVTRSWRNDPVAAHNFPALASDISVYSRFSPLWGFRWEWMCGAVLEGIPGRYMEKYWVEDERVGVWKEQEGGGGSHLLHTPCVLKNFAQKGLFYGMQWWKIICKAYSLH